MQNSSLPEADDIATEHSIRLRSAIEEAMQAAGGAVSFAQYMQLALYEPGLGYYMAGAAKFGAQGDFITAPEVSPLFGRALAVQIAEVLDDIGGSVLELGAGSGKLAFSIVSALDERADFSYCILEPSAELAQRQRQFLGDALPAAALSRVKWLDRLPTEFTGVVLANEVMDALPVERVRMASTGWQQMCVASGFTWDQRPASEKLFVKLRSLEADLGYKLPQGYESEVCLLLAPWIKSIADTLDKGAVLLIDYGYPRQEYYSLERNQGTLACFYRHRTHDDPLQLPGLQDITAHVDFTAVAEAAVSADLELLGYATQSAFLLDNNLLEMADSERELLEQDIDHLSLANEIKTLTLPGEMGERFQVMALGCGYDRPLRGFRSQDLTYRL